MPYITTYNVSITNISDKSDNEAIIETINKSVTNTINKSLVNKGMINISSKYPGKLFIVNSQGENTDDVSEIKYLNGVSLR